MPCRLIGRPKDYIVVFFEEALLFELRKPRRLFLTMDKKSVDYFCVTKRLAFQS